MSSRSNKYHGQIKADLRYLEPGQKLFYRAIASIRGIVETEQTEIDRNLQTTIAVVGARIGAAGVVAASAPYWIEEKPGVININEQFSLSAFATFMLIIFLSLSAGLLTWVIANSLRKWKRHNKKSKLQGKLTQNQASLAQEKVPI
ncbi:hypothetical protein QUA13_25860 [Microcoleus sp. S28C3]|uniref:hypothetical protein n=1 Tax=Microcoleus sp. S28C3 TaxID=3055414 RepID=UPI002FD62D68